jgi:hypothetical protein
MFGGAGVGAECNAATAQRLGLPLRVWVPETSTSTFKVLLFISFTMINSLVHN